MATLAQINSTLQEQTKVLAKEESLADNSSSINSLSARISDFLDKDKANRGDRLEDKAEKDRARKSSKVIKAKSSTTADTSRGGGLLGLGGLMGALGPALASIAGMAGLATGTALLDQDIGLPGNVDLGDAAKGLGAAFVTSLITKNPFIRIGTLLGGMYGDEIAKLLGGEDGKINTAFGDIDLNNTTTQAIIGGALLFIAPKILRFGAAKAVAATTAILAARKAALDANLSKIADEAADDIAKAAGGTGTRRTPPLTSTQRNAFGGYDEFKVKTPKTPPLTSAQRNAFGGYDEFKIKPAPTVMSNAPRISSPASQTTDDILKAIGKQIDDLPITRTGPASLYTPSRTTPRPLTATRTPPKPIAPQPIAMNTGPMQPKAPSAADLEAEKIFKKKWVPDWLKKTAKLAGRYVPPAIMAYDGYNAVNDPTLQAQESLSAIDRFSIGALASIASIADLPSEVSNLTNMGLNKIFDTDLKTDYKLLGDERVGERVYNDLAKLDQKLANADAAIAQKVDQSSARLKNFVTGYGDQIDQYKITAYESRGLGEYGDLNIGPQMTSEEMRRQAGFITMPSLNAELMEKVNSFSNSAPPTNVITTDNSTNSQSISNSSSSYVGGNNSADQWSLYP
jgi:hypothetical protein